jgi:hypothetical protein
VVEHPRAHPTGLTPVQSPVHHQQAEIADRLGSDVSEEEEVDETAEVFEAEAQVEPEVEADAAPAPQPVVEAVRAPVAAAAAAFVPAPRRATKPRSAPGSKGKAAFTLRLDSARHLKLRLACAVNGRSAQQIVTDALDQLLAAMPELDAMAAKAKPKG